MIRRVFAENYVFHTSEKNIIVVASTASARESLPASRPGEGIGPRFKATFSFQDVLKNLAR